MNLSASTPEVVRVSVKPGTGKFLLVCFETEGGLSAAFLHLTVEELEELLEAIETGLQLAHGDPEYRK
jgi:hypothetical protein